MNKNVLIGIIALVIVVGGAFLLYKGNQLSVDTGALSSEEKSFTSLENDMSSFAQDETVLNEVNQTYNDIAQDSGAVSSSDAFNGASIASEARQVDFSSDVNAFNSDNVALQGASQASGEVAQ